MKYKWIEVIKVVVTDIRYIQMNKIKTQTEIDLREILVFFYGVTEMWSIFFKTTVDFTAVFTQKAN